MNDFITRFLNTLEVDKAFNYLDFKVYPILTQRNSSVNYISLRKAIENDYITLVEIDNVGSVSEIVANNNSDKKIFIWDGEVLVGAKQNRVANSSMLIKENSEVIIPVSCVEQGRWSYDSLKFGVSEVPIPKQMNNFKSKSVYTSLKKSKRHESNQSGIWHKIEHLSNNLQIKSKTMALDDIVKQKEQSTIESSKFAKSLENQCGVIIANNDGILGMEYISKYEVFEDLYSRILKSYTFIPNASKNLTKVRLGQPKTVKDFFLDIKDVMVEKYKSVGLGNDYRFVRNDIVGSTLIYKKSIVSFSLSYFC